MASVNYNHKWLYLFEPHTASRATRDALAAAVPGTAKVGHHHIGSEELQFWRRQHIDPKDFAPLTRICTVRNPLDTLVTRWRINPQRTKPLAQFVADNIDHNIIRNPGFGLWEEAHIVAYYEDLQADLRWIFTNESIDLGWDDGHKTPGKDPWWMYYTEELFNTVCDLYRPYLDKYGYSTEWKDGTPQVVALKEVRAVRTVPVCSFNLPK